MRTAESIISEYLSQGYNLESLRVLAESRSEPLRSEMLARLDAMRSSGMKSGEAAAPVFFVAADEESVAGDDILDFDIMADVEGGPTPAVGEESVAEIVVGQNDGSVLLASQDESVAEVEVGGVEYFDGTPVGQVLKIADKAEEAICEEISGDIMAESSAVLTNRGELIEVASVENVPVEAEGSDYLPGSRTFEPLAEPEIASDLDAAEPESEVVTKAQEALMAAQEAVSECLETALTPIVQTAPESASVREHPAAESRRERRRRERAQKRKKKQAKTNMVDDETPEISTIRSEGTEILVPSLREDGVMSSPTLTSLDKLDDVTQHGIEDFLVADEEVMLPLSLTTEPPSQEHHVSEAAKSYAEAATPEAGDLADHVMILANGGLDFRADVYSLLDDEAMQESVLDAAPAAENNIILFRRNDGVEGHESPLDAEELLSEDPPLLHLLEMAEESEVEALAESAPETTAVTGLSPMDQLGLLRALVGAPQPDEISDDVEDTEAAEGHHAIVTAGVEPYEPPQAEDIAAALEKEYQERVDNLAQLLLEVQGQVAEADSRCRVARDEANQREADIRDLKERLTARERKADDYAAELAQVKNDSRKKDERIKTFEGIRNEHERLYSEYEDLRRAYNEVVTDVMPSLQNERDELALTVERQCGESDELRRALGGARRRTAMSYALSAAACVMLVALPVMNWLRADSSHRDMAINHQQVSDLTTRLEKAELLNVEYDKAMYNLSYQVDKLQEESEKLRYRNTELAKLVDGKGGSPTRASTMALAGPVGPDGTLQRNDVRDPAGSIDQVVARNRELYNSEVPAPPGVTGSTRVQVSAVASPRGERRTGALRPAVEQTPKPAVAAASKQAKKGVTATVKAGEGVAQVVYRVLGTRDPEVIAWVIRENGIKNDKRGNPRIYPDQKLVLPKGERVVGAAAVASR